ncbi:ER membrane protein complex subunit 4 [Eurytemora carolleeae]|uniref:ER membrane protein complex subunit 4 n=1 Tax=Eurytemora carolleeae TaxID=1294199 RepID=UPI000C78549B|nr:ER membrane protein complex subunit 4 [Eurytemora carolleeae]|eukprot:XP_023330684.1 ER membrane protein complex subunit 4-like [Eurytemora affinis]
MSVGQDKSMSRPRSAKPRWQLDFSKSSGGSELSSPPGYAPGAASTHHEASRESDPNLRIKRSWDVALGPMKQVPMNLFIMYMSGNSISIFPIMMVIMMMVRPVKTMFTVKQTFKSFESGSGGIVTNTIGQKFVFVLGNLANLALAMYKCHGMGLLPTHASDWLAFADPLERAEYGLGSIGL